MFHFRGTVFPLWPQGTLNNCSHLTELIGVAARETQGQERALGEP